jgi:DNA polymerase-1
MPIQGTEADLMKMAMIELEKRLPKGANQILQVHDSILVECDKSQADEVTKILKDVMENIYPALGIRLVVDAGMSTNWSDL